MSSLKHASQRCATAALAAILSFAADSSSAQDAASAPAASETTASSPSATKAERQQSAIEALDAMGSYLRSLAEFQVEADTATDAILDSGQTVTFLHRTVVKVERPNRLRADIKGARATRGLVYDGRTFTIYNSTSPYYTRNTAPPTIDALVRGLATDYGIETPLADLFYWGNGKVDDPVLTSALFIGLERVGTRWCNHYAYQQAGTDWELWLETGRHPLPCRMTIIDTSQAERPRHTVTYHWDLETSFTTSTFSYRLPPGAKAVPLEPARESPLKENE